MEEKFINKLEKLLNKSGLGEEEIDKILEIATNEPSNEEEPTTELEGENLPKEEPENEEVVEEQPKVEVEVETEPEKEEEQPELPPEVEQVQPEEQQEIPAPVNDGIVVELQSKVDELSKANEGLIARLTALEEALKKSKVLTENEGAIGVDQNYAPANDPLDDPMTSVLAKINGRRL